MPWYTYESSDGRTVELPFRMAECPKTVVVDGVEYRKILSRVLISIPAMHRAVNEGQVSKMLHDLKTEFEAPNPNNPGGVSDEELVKTGQCTTLADSKWV